MNIDNKTLVIAATCGLAFAASGAIAADAHVQQQLQQREQQQMELRLKMQQQLDRAIQVPQGIQVPPGIQAPAGTSADLKRRQLDRDQQQRLRQLHEQQSRSLLTPPPPVVPGQMAIELERQRAQQRGSEELKQFEIQRRMDGDSRAP
jgi:hypothetical protein